MKNAPIKILLFIMLTGLAYAGPRGGGFNGNGGGSRGGGGGAHFVGGRGGGGRGFGAPIGVRGYSGNFVTGNVYGGRYGGYGYGYGYGYGGGYGFRSGCRASLDYASYCYQPTLAYSPLTWGFGYISGGAGENYRAENPSGPLEYIYWSPDIASYVLWRDGFEFPVSRDSQTVQDFLKSQRQKNK